MFAVLHEGGVEDGHLIRGPALRSGPSVALRVRRGLGEEVQLGRLHVVAEVSQNGQHLLLGPSGPGQGW